MRPGDAEGKKIGTRTNAGSRPKRRLRERSLVVDVAPFFEELPKPLFPLGKGGSGNQTSKTDSVFFGNPIQNADRSPVAKENPLGIHSH